MFWISWMRCGSRLWRHVEGAAQVTARDAGGIVAPCMRALLVLGVFVMAHIPSAALAFSSTTPIAVPEVPQCNGDERVKLCRMYRLEGFDVLLRLRKQTAAENKMYKRVSLGWGLGPATEAPMHFLLIKTPLATTEVCHGIDPHDMQSGITETGDFWCAMSKDPLRCIRCEVFGSYVNACKVADWSFRIVKNGVIEEKSPEFPDGSVYDGKAIWKFKDGICEYSTPFSSTHSQSAQTALKCSAVAGRQEK